MTKEFKEGINAREFGIFLSDNPYSRITELEEYQEWANGWKLENWRLRKNAERKEADRQIHID